MKTVMTLVFSLLLFLVKAQDNVHTFQSSQIKINNNGQQIETSTTSPSIIRVDIAAGTLSLETENVEVRDMLKEQSQFEIIKQMGQMRAQYSLQIGEFLLAHFYSDMGMVIFTRTDVHPLQWGIQFQHATKL